MLAGGDGLGREWTEDGRRLPVAAHYLSIGELLAHMIDARVSWFYEWMGEGNADTAHWDKERGGDEQAVYEAAELVAMFEKTWHVISSAMTRWTCADVDAQHYRELTEQLYHTLVANMKKEQS